MIWWLSNQVNKSSRSFINYFLTIKMAWFLFLYSLYYPLTLHQWVFKIKEINSNKFIFSNNNIEIIVEIQKFEASKHKIKHKTVGDNKGLIIDDYANFWGFYNQIPRNEIQSIVLKSKNYTYTFPKQAICGLYEVTLEHCRIYSGKNNEIFIHLPGGDGADGYSACWSLKNNKLFAMTVLATVP